MSSSTAKITQRSKILSEIGTASLLGVVPGLSDLVLSRGEVQLVTPQQHLFPEGEAITHLVVPLSDDLRLVKRDAAGASVPVGTLQRKRALALRQILEGGVYPYSAVAQAPTLVLLLPKKNFLDLLAAQPRVEHYLRLMTSSAGVRGFKRFLTEEGLGTEELLALLERVQGREYALDARNHYAPAEQRLVFVNSGQLLYSGTESGQRYSGVLGPGAWFGGEALVPPGRLSYSVMAIERSTFHAVRLSEVEAQLRRLGLIDRLYGEPCVTRVLPRRRAEAGGAARPLPGRVLSLEQALELRLPVLDPDQLTEAGTDLDSHAASIANLAELLGVRINPPSVKNDLAIAGALSPLRLAETLEPYGLVVRCLASSQGELPRQRLPALVRLGARLCVLLRARGRKGPRYVLDPAAGIVELAEKDFAALWDGQLLEVGRTSLAERADGEPGAGPGPQPQSLQREMFGLLRLFRGPLANVLLLSLATFGLMVLMPVFSQVILDEVLTLRDTTTLWTCVIGMVLATFFLVLFAIAKVLVSSEFAYRYDFMLSSRFYRHVLSLPARMFERSRAGGVIARLMELWAIRDFLSSSSIQSITELFSIVVFTVVLFFYSWKVAAVPLLGIPVMVLLQYAFKRRLARNYEAAFEADSASKSLLSEQISAVMTVKAVGMEASARKRWEEAYLRRVNHERRAQVDVTSIQGVTGFLSRMTNVVGIWVAAVLALDGEISPGALLAITMYLDQMVAPAANVADVFSRFEKVRVAVRKISDLTNARSELSPAEAHSHYSFPLKGKIRFERVSFRYNEDSPWVLRDVSFTIYPRQVVAVVGKSGCGKSTLANLIAGNLRPTSGRIFYDDFDSSFVSLPTLRRQIGFIMQSRDLYSGTIRENIAFSDDAPDDERIEEASRQAHAQDFIRGLPAGLSHYLGEGGLGLSGGQMQRLTIARTLYRRPNVVLLDEATSALDATSERAVLDNLRTQLAGKTTILIAHRVTTIRGADNILVFKEGELVEQGPHKDLIHANGLYQELFESRAESPEG